MTYTIEKNNQFGSLEVYFSDKPSQMIRDTLKLLRFRWHSVKKCWYGFAEETKLRETLCTASADQNDVIVTDDYLGPVLSTSVHTGHKKRPDASIGSVFQAFDYSSSRSNSSSS